MRMPSLAELDQDQRELFTESPDTGCIVITGPPGTGKTVVALHRAVRLSNEGGHVTIVMYNNVLKAYTGEANLLTENINVFTMNKWAFEWYRAAFKVLMPMIGKPRFKNPDWPQIRRDIIECDDTAILNALNWGHLIIDEGQDFPEEMYNTFHDLLNHKKFTFCSTLTVFADDNQAITDSNSTIEEIILALNVKVKNRNLWRLDKNYRNCMEVARLAKYFQLSHAGSARLPEVRTGQVPRVFFREKKGQIVQQILQYTKANGSIEVGVVIFGSTKAVQSAFNGLTSQLANMTQTDIVLQGYSTKVKRDSPLKDAQKLKFSKTPCITVLNSKSAKGLEFDSVFVLNLDGAGMIDEEKALNCYKDLYVVSSRARSGLFFMIEAKDETVHQNITLLPSPKLDDELIEYFDVNSRDWLKNELDKFEWESELNPRHQLRKKSEALATLVKNRMSKDGIRELVEPFIRQIKRQQIATLIEDRINSEKIEDLADLILEVGLKKVEKVTIEKQVINSKELES